MMRRNLHFGISLVFFFAVFMLVSCNKAPQGDNAIITDQVLPKEGTGQAFIVDTVRSWIRFTGTGEGKDCSGTLKLSYGKVNANDDKVTGGTFIVNILSLDMKEEGQLTLAAGEAFDKKSFGTSQFEITNIGPYKPREGEKSLIEGLNFSVSGNLEIMNVTKNITFPAHIELKGNRLEANSGFEIDRRQWEMSYGKHNTLAESVIPGKAKIEFYLVALIDEQQTY